MSLALSSPVVAFGVGFVVACDNGTTKRMPVQVCPQGVQQGTSSPDLVLNIFAFETACHWLETQTVIGYFVGRTPSESMLHEWVTKAWTPRGIHLEGIQSLTKGFFLFHFGNPS